MHPQHRQQVGSHRPATALEQSYGGTQSACWMRCTATALSRRGRSCPACWLWSQTLTGAS